MKVKFDTSKRKKIRIEEDFVGGSDWSIRKIGSKYVFRCQVEYHLGGELTGVIEEEDFIKAKRGEIDARGIVHKYKFS